MNFTPKRNVRPAIRGLLTIAVVGLIGWVSHVARTPAPIVATEHTYTVQQPFQTDITVPVVPAVLIASDLQTAARSEYYLPVSKHWWKRNAPIVGGAAGGALVGGLIGGGPGALIGGAAGGTGGYLYKRSRHHHHYH